MTRKKLVLIICIVLVIGYVLGQMPILGNQSHVLKFREAEESRRLASEFWHIRIPKSKFIGDGYNIINYDDVNMALNSVNICLSILTTHEYETNVFSISKSKRYEWLGLKVDELDFMKEFLSLYKVMLTSMLEKDFALNEEKLSSVKKIEDTLKYDIFIAENYLTDSESASAKDFFGTSIGTDGTKYNSHKLDVLVDAKIIGIMKGHKSLMNDLRDFKNEYYPNLAIGK